MKIIKEAKLGNISLSINGEDEDAIVLTLETGLNGEVHNYILKNNPTNKESVIVTDKLGTLNNSVTSLLYEYFGCTTIKEACLLDVLKVNPMFLTDWINGLAKPEIQANLKKASDREIRKSTIKQLLPNTCRTIYDFINTYSQILNPNASSK